MSKLIAIHPATPGHPHDDGPRRWPATSELSELHREFIRLVESFPMTSWRASLFRIINAAIDTQFFDDGDRASTAGPARFSGWPIAGENMAELSYRRAEFARRVDRTPISWLSPEVMRVVNAAIDAGMPPGRRPDPVRLRVVR